MKIPTELKHKPVIVAEDYESIDGRKSGRSDAKGLSLGLAQWNDRGRVDISAKVWRYTGEKWSRQSEELPIHRVLDLCILITRSMRYFREAYRQDKLFDPQNTEIGHIALQESAMSINICADNPMINQDIELFMQALRNDDEMLSERFAILAQQLKELGFR
ncbi:MAG: DUF6530 family protein [Clostridiales bacterium]|jgi:hypothetical protein|nr:DUF6530 family protein [Clostridiales bacterium]